MNTARAMEIFERMINEESYRFIPLLKGGKNPAAKAWQHSNYQADDIRDWLKQNLNIGRIDDRTATLDFESYSEARLWFKTWNPRKVLLVLTRRGVHMTFNAMNKEIRNAVNVNGKYDIRAGGNGYCVFPPSMVKGFTYKLVDGWDTTDPEKLDTFRDDWLPKHGKVDRSVVFDASKYIAKIVSEQGANGSGQLLRACCKLRDANLTQAEAMLEIIRWNETNAIPSWSDAELLRCIRRAYEVYQ